VDAVPALATIVEDDADGLQYAVYALSRITREYPEEVKPVAETLGEVTLRDSLSDSVRLNATAGGSAGSSASTRVSPSRSSTTLRPCSTPITPSSGTTQSD